MIPPKIARISLNLQDLRNLSIEQKGRLEEQQEQVKHCEKRWKDAQTYAKKTKEDYKRQKDDYFTKYGEMKEKALQKKLEEIKPRIPEPHNARGADGLNVDIYTEWLEGFRSELEARWEAESITVDNMRNTIDDNIQQEAARFNQLKVKYYMQKLSKINLFLERNC